MMGGGGRMGGGDMMRRSGGIMKSKMGGGGKVGGRGSMSMGVTKKGSGRSGASSSGGMKSLMGGMKSLTGNRPSPAPGAKQQFWCSSCNVAASTEALLIQHMSGKKHNLKIVKAAAAEREMAMKEKEMKLLAQGQKVTTATNGEAKTEAVAATAASSTDPADKVNHKVAANKLCFNCKSPGHFANKCPTSPAKPAKSAAAPKSAPAAKSAPVVQKGKKRKVSEELQPLTGIKGNMYWCFPCVVSCNRIDQLEMHLNGKKHAFKVVNLGGPSKFTKHEPLGPLVGNGGEQVEPSSVKTGHLRDRKRPKLDDNMKPMPMIGIRPAYWCNMCYISLPDQKHLDRHMQAKKHSVTLAEYGESGVLSKFIPVEETRLGPVYGKGKPQIGMKDELFFCFLCSETLTETVEVHVKSESHVLKEQEAEKKEMEGEEEEEEEKIVAGEKVVEEKKVEEKKVEEKKVEEKKVEEEKVEEEKVEEEKVEEEKVEEEKVEEEKVEEEQMEDVIEEK